MTKENDKEKSLTLKDVNIVKSFENFIKVFSDDIEVRKHEIDYKREVELKTLEQADSDSQRNFEIYMKGFEEESKAGKFRRTIGYIVIIAIMLSLIYGFYLVSIDKQIGKDIIIGILGVIAGAIGGWGFAQKDRDSE